MADLTKTVSIIFEGEDRVTVTTDKIARTFTAVGTEAGAAASKVDQLDKEMDDLGKKAPALSSVATALQALAASLAVKAFIDANVEAEKFTRTENSAFVNGNGINKPKANRAAMQQNLEWFTRYIWNQPAGTQQ